MTPSNSKHYLTILFCLSIITTFGQSLNADWKNDLTGSLQQFMNCQSSECVKYIGESLNKLYKVNDFYSAKSGRYMTASEISDYLKGGEKWKLIGPSYDQKSLATAQDLANAKKAVVAVYMNEAGVGHVVIITPGQLQPSGSWGLNVPNVVSFLPSQPDKSFVDKGLSFAFGKNLMKDVLIYARNY